MRRWRGGALAPAAAAEAPRLTRAVSVVGARPERRQRQASGGLVQRSQVVRVRRKGCGRRALVGSLARPRGRPRPRRCGQPPAWADRGQGLGDAPVAAAAAESAGGGAHPAASASGSCRPAQRPAEPRAGPGPAGHPGASSAGEPLGLAAPLCPGPDSRRPRRPGGGGSSGPARRPQPWLLRRAAELPTCRRAPSLPSRRVRGRGQMTTSPRSSSWQLSPPTVTLTSTQSATAPRPMYCGDSVRPGRCRLPGAGLGPHPPPAPPPAPTLTSNLMACSSGFRGARSVLGGWGGDRKRKPGSVKPAAPSPRALRFPVTHPWAPRTTYSGRRHRCVSGRCPKHCRAQARGSGRQPAHGHAGPRSPAGGGAGLRGPAGLPPSWPVPAWQLPAPLTGCSTAVSPSWNDSARRHTEVRCWPRMVTWEPLRRRAGQWA